MMMTMMVMKKRNRRRIAVIKRKVKPMRAMTNMDSQLKKKNWKVTNVGKIRSPDLTKKLVKRNRGYLTSTEIHQVKGIIS